jgi:spore coat polysaccharide biosynthesis predicted glycosyltransferase SpsG
VTSAVLAFDAGPSAGMGHRRRMEALAEALRQRGVSASLVPSDQEVEADLVVVDSYQCRADDTGRFRGRVVAAVDDLQRDLAVDVLVDPSPGSTGAPHGRAVAVLAGPAYALIDPALRHARPKAVGAEVRVALVTCGAADTEGVAAAVATRLASLLPTVETRLVVGPWDPTPVPAGIVPVRAEAGLGSALADADLVVTAAGVTLLETLALGRPAVTVVLADNQRQAAEGAAAAGAAVLSDPEQAAEVAAHLAGDETRRHALADAARVLVDGRGAERVAGAVLDGR